VLAKQPFHLGLACLDDRLLTSVGLNACAVS
jgi:hypothetical protein